MIGEGALSPGPALWVGKREVAHLDDDRRLDVRLTKEVIRSRRTWLKADGRVLLRPKSSDWLEVRIESAEDVEFALSLVEDAIAAIVKAPLQDFHPLALSLNEGDASTERGTDIPGKSSRPVRQLSQGLRLSGLGCAESIVA